jgi:hypothetical protein
MGAVGGLKPDPSLITEANVCAGVHAQTSRPSACSLAGLGFPLASSHQRPYVKWLW